MSMLDAMLKRQAEFKAKIGSRSGAADLWTKDGDITYFHIIRDDISHGEMYVAHNVPVEGSPYGKLVYCPLHSFHDENAANYDCPYDDDEEQYPLKQRILMWLWVHKNLRLDSMATGDNDKQLPTEERGGQLYRVREFNRPVLWEVSGWQSFSPLTDFNVIRENLGGDLTSRMLMMRQIGKGLDMKRRFDVVMDSGPLEADKLQQGLDVKPVREILMERLLEGSQAGGTVTREQANQTMERAGHKPLNPTPSPPPAPPVQESLSPEPNLPPASDPEGFVSNSYTFDPEDPFGS